MAGIVQSGPAVFYFLFSFSWLFENVLVPERKECLCSDIRLRIEDSDRGLELL